MSAAISSKTRDLIGWGRSRRSLMARINGAKQVMARVLTEDEEIGRSTLCLKLILFSLWEFLIPA